MASSSLSKGVTSISVLVENNLDCFQSLCWSDSSKNYARASLVR